ncbi:MAG: VWA domain-containing protein [Alphaproteobacteria bacterium]|nr:VWA domain-containing protein [Alphaproteobacteria bacterium]
MTDVSVLRPWALFFLIPCVLFCFFKLKSVQTWSGIVDSHLLETLTVKAYVRFKQKLSAFLLLLSVCSFLAALSGVSFKSGRAALYHPKSPAVIVLDMSLSMKVKDVYPNRFSRAIFKIYDLLEGLKGVPVSFVVFTDEPYRLIPSTTDKGVLENILPLLNFSLMPSQGGRTDRAIREALDAIKETGARFGDIFLITDGAEDVFEIQDKTQELVLSAFKEGNRLFILGVGTPEGGGLFEKNDVPVLDALGNPVIHRLKEGYLKLLAQTGGGKYVRVQMDNSDVSALVEARSFPEAGRKSRLTDDASADTGYFFLIPLLIVFPFLFQRGRLLIAVLGISASFPAQADVLDAFLSPSAAAMRLLARGWQTEAAATAERSNDFTALYNVGTRLIFLKDYPQAIALLEKAVQIRPENEDAQINLEIARRLNERPPEDGNSGKGGGGQAGNPNQSDNKQEDSDGKKNLNQNDNIDKQDNENKENLNKNKRDNEERAAETSSGEGGAETDEAGNDVSGSGNDGEKKDEGADDGKNDSEQPEERNDENKMKPVYEDPLTLLRHKILFLHRQKRYDQEKQLGVQW